MKRSVSFVVVLGTLAVLLETLVRLGAMNRIFFPPPSAVLMTLGELVSGPVLWAAVSTTVISMATGFVLAMGLAIPVGTAMGQSLAVRRMFEPVVDSLRPMPSAAVIPVAILLFGLGFQMRTTVIVFGSIWPIIINTMDGIKGVDPLLVDTGRLLRFRGAKLLWRVILPAALPSVFTGLRISLGIALILTVTTEMIAGTGGLGYFILDAQRSFAFREMFAGIVAVGAIGYLMTQVFSLVERRALFWHVSVRRDGAEPLSGSGAETFSGLEATSTEARDLRRRLNDVHSPHPLHAAFPEDLWPLDEPSRVLWIGIDVVSFVPMLAKRWSGTEFVAAHWRPVALQDLTVALAASGDSSRVEMVRWHPQNGALLQNRDISFDVVGCTYSLHDLNAKQAEGCLERVASLLRPGGLAYFATHAKASFDELFVVYRAAASACGLKTLAQATWNHFDTFCQEDAEVHLSKWFRNVEFRSFDTSLTFGPGGLDNFLAYASIFPFPGLTDLSIRDRERLWMAFREHAARLPILKVTKPSGIFLCATLAGGEHGRDPQPVRVAQSRAPAG